LQLDIPNRASNKLFSRFILPNKDLTGLQLDIPIPTSFFFRYLPTILPQAK